MQVAAMNPVAVRAEEVPQNVIDTEMEIARDKARHQANQKICSIVFAQGALQSITRKMHLLQQEFIKDSKISIEEYLRQQSKTLTILAFSRVTLNVD